jgi:hypothetical protein
MFDLVLPAYFPSISMSLSAGELVIVTLACVGAGASVLLAGLAFGAVLGDLLGVGAGASVLPAGLELGAVLGDLPGVGSDVFVCGVALCGVAVPDVAPEA